MEDDSEDIAVGVADMRVCSDGRTLVSSALGSCVGIAMHDPTRQIGGLAHIMLPAQIQTNGAHPVGKFADLAIPALIEEMVVAGAARTRLVAKIAGGAEMFGDSGVISIGERNVLAAKSLLQEAGIKVISADTGGHHARTVQFDTSTGILTIRSVRFGAKEL